MFKSILKYSKIFPCLSLGIILFFSGCKTVAPALDSNQPLTPPKAVSVVNTPILIPSETLTRLLNSQLPPTLYEARDQSFGNGIEGSLTLKRAGNISWNALDSQAIEIMLPIQISGEMGLKRSGLGSFIRGRIPINESFKPTFVIDPRINPDWSIGVDAFELVDLGGDLEMDIMGMEVDLTGMLQQQIRKWGQENLVQKPSVFTLKPIIELAWAQAGKPILLEYQGIQKAYSIQPQNVLLNDFFDPQGNLNLWLGMNGAIASHPADAAPSRPFPLPPLISNQDSSNHFEIILPFSLSYSEIDRLLTENLVGKTFRIDKKTTFIGSNLRTQSLGQSLGVTMDFIAQKENGKEISGELFLVGKPEYDQKTESIVFRQIDFDLSSDSFQANTGAGLKRKKIIRQMEKQAKFPIGEIVDGSIASIQDRLGLKTPIANFQIIDLEVMPSGFYPQKESLLIHLKGTGQIGTSFK